jgi:hypothetical protein
VADAVWAYTPPIELSYSLTCAARHHLHIGSPDADPWPFAALSVIEGLAEHEPERFTGDLANTLNDRAVALNQRNDYLAAESASAHAIACWE